jgi:hypothetical protein
MVNKELLKNTLDLIKLKPAEHDQAKWVTLAEWTTCGTTMCFAGHAAVLSGAAEIPDPKKHSIDDWYVGKDGEYLNYYQMQSLSPYEFTSVAKVAQVQLGLTGDQADYLFGPDLDVEDLENAVDDLLNDREIAALLYDEDDEDDDDDWDACECCG